MFCQTGSVMNRVAGTISALAVVAALTLGMASSTLAITWDLVGTGDWNTAENWDPDGLPTTSDTVNVNNGGTAQIGSEGAVANRFYIDGGSSIAFSGGATTTFSATGNHSYVGNNSTGTFTQTGGAFSIGQQALYVGNNATGNGAYNISGGSLACRYIRVGQNGTGVFNHSGGSVTVSLDNLVVGRYSPADGTYNLSGTGVLTAPNEYVGCWGDGTGGTGVFNQSGGTNTIAGNLYLGSSTTTETTTGGTGTYTLSAGTLAVSGDIVDRGGTGGVSNFNIDGTTYTLTVSGGDITVDNFAVGPANNASFTQKAGLATTVNNNLSIGASGTTSSVNVTGGTLSVGGDITGGGDSRLYINAFETAYSLTVTGGDIGVDRFVVGSGSSSTGEFTLAAGLKLTTDWQYIGENGTGTLTQTGGTNQVTNGTGAIYVGHGSDATGTYNMTGGALVTNYVRVGENGTGTFNHSGGTVTVNSENSGWNLIVGRRDGSDGTYNLSGTGQVSAGNEYVGGHESAGTGYFNQSGGSNVASGNLQIGGGGGVGTYTISAGTLDVDGTLYVGSGGTGTFHIIGDQATIEVDGYSQNADSTLELTINSISPINVDGAISLAGALDVEFASLPDIEDVFPIFINDGDDLVSGIFRDKPEGYVFSLAGTYIDMVLTYEANLDGGSIGNDVALRAVPEPSAILLLLLGILALGALRRRRE